MSTSVPAWAGASDRVKFEIKPRVVSQIVDRSEGETTLLVASNAAFEISAAGMIGNVTVTIEKSGYVEGNSFGSSSQLPGTQISETFLSTAFETSIYQSERKTAQRRGSPLDQAVLVRISYSGVNHPVVNIETSPQALTLS